MNKSNYSTLNSYLSGVWSNSIIRPGSGLWMGIIGDEYSHGWDEIRVCKCTYRKEAFQSMLGIYTYIISIQNDITC